MGKTKRSLYHSHIVWCQKWSGGLFRMHRKQRKNDCKNNCDRFICIYRLSNNRDIIAWSSMLFFTAPMLAFYFIHQHIEVFNDCLSTSILLRCPYMHATTVFPAFSLDFLNTGIYWINVDSLSPPFLTQISL